jgi:hypothetical protein
MEMTFYGKILQIVSVRGLVELEHRRIAHDGPSNFLETQLLDLQQHLGDSGTSAKIDASAIETTPLV